MREKIHVKNFIKSGNFCRDVVVAVSLLKKIKYNMSKYDRNGF